MKPMCRGSVGRLLPPPMQVGAQAWAEGKGLRGRADPNPAAGGCPVGRNDPCPCGSGKKFKRCCRPARLRG